VRRIVVVSPPGPDGEVSPQVLLAARILGLDEVYRVGGAQAVAALAYGTATLPRVDKIYGPGNAYVAEAKKQLYGDVGIDMLAGPSELVVYADASTEPEWVAADLMAQAEHDESTRITLLASAPGVLAAVRKALERELPRQPRREIIEAALRNGGSFEVVESHSAAAERINEIAPEHLSLQVSDPAMVLPLVRNAGAIFLGAFSPVAVGDYYAGPNHVLPTGTTARFASCLSVEDFMKRSNVVSMGPDFLRRRGEDVEILAEGEQLSAHAFSVSIRRKPNARGCVRRGVRAVTPYVLVEEDAPVKLNQNESPWDIPDELKDEVSRRLREIPWNRYHQKLPQDFMDALAASARLGPENVLAASGSNLILQWIFEALGGPGRTVLYPTPSFSLYPLWAEVTETQVATLSLRADFEYDVEALLAEIACREPAITILCLPNNPTGTEMLVPDVCRVAEACAAVGGVLVVDEAYREFSGKVYDRVPLVREFDNVLLVRTFSKAFSSAGIRLGYLFAAPVLVEQLKKMVPPFHLNLFATVLGQVILENGPLFRERVERLLGERARVTGALQQIESVEVFPTHANFFLIRAQDGDALYQRLKDGGVLVRAPAREPLLENCLRINVGTPEENDRLLALLRKA